MMAVRQAATPRASKKSNKFSKIKKKDEKKTKEKPSEKVGKPTTVNKVLLVEQEIKFALKLAGNDKKASDKVLKSLKKWLTYRSAGSLDFTEYDFIRLWKGLFYCVWMSDKPLVQENLCESIASLFECFGDKKMATSCLFYKCFLFTMAENWMGIDQHRIDKFLMFVRRVTRAIFKCAKNLSWSKESLELITDCLSGKKGILSANPPKESRSGLGLLLHLSDCWMEEVAKISEGALSGEALTELCRPFAQYLSYGDEPRLSSAIVKNIFTHLIRQTDLGIDYQEKLLAWRNAGYPGGNIDSMEKVELSDQESEKEVEEEEEDNEAPKKKTQALDPRAGFVDAVLPQLPVDGEMIASLLRSMVSDPRSTSNNRNKLKSVSQYFETLASGVYPFKAKNMTLPSDPRFKLPKAAKAAQELLDYEKKCAELYDEDDMKGLNRRQRRKLLMAQKKQLESELTGADKEREESSAPPKKQKKNTLDLNGWQVEDIPDPSENSTPDTSKSVSLKTHPLKQNRDKNRKVKNNSLKKSNKSDNNSMPINKKGKKENNKKLLATSGLSNGVAKENSSTMNDTGDRETPKSNKKNKLNKSNITTPLGNSQQKNLGDSQKTMSHSKQQKSLEDITLGELKKISVLQTPNTKQKHSPSSNQKKLNVSDASTPAIKQKKSANLSVVQQRILDSSDMITPQKKQKKLSMNLTNGNVSTCSTPSSNNLVSKSVIKEFKSKNRDASTPISNKKNKRNDKLISPVTDKPISTESLPKKSPDTTPKSKPVKSNLVTPQNKIIPKDITGVKKSDKKSSNKSMTETEIFIPNRVNLLKNASKRLNTSDSGLLKGKKTRLNGNLSMDSSSPGSKKVMIALKKNTAQSVLDFFKSVKQSPEIPFDGGKKPLKTSLKPNLIPSPINPFYRKKLK